jgi:hypothetical protein
MNLFADGIHELSQAYASLSQDHCFSLQSAIHGQLSVQQFCHHTVYRPQLSLLETNLDKAYRRKITAEHL